LGDFYQIEILGLLLYSGEDTMEHLITDRKKLEEWVTEWINECRNGRYIGVTRIREMANRISDKYETVDGLWDPDAKSAYEYLMDMADEAQEAYEDAQPPTME
jgi:phosphate uptake regulator